MVAEQRTVSGQFVQVGGLYCGVFKNRQALSTPLIRSDKQQIGFLFHLGSNHSFHGDECLPAPHPIKNLPDGLDLSICSLPLIILNKN
jgi:hypothetical protein